MECHCCSGLNFADCCQPFLLGTKKVETAESMMRSRYSAYVVVDVDYILKTTHRATRHLHQANTIKQWAKSSIWEKLEIISTQAGGETDVVGRVEFKAHFLDSNKRAQVHYEHSSFSKENGCWYFVDGLVL